MYASPAGACAAMRKGAHWQQRRVSSTKGHGRAPAPAHNVYVTAAHCACPRSTLRSNAYRCSIAAAGGCVHPCRTSRHTFLQERAAGVHVSDTRAVCAPQAPPPPSACNAQPAPNPRSTRTHPAPNLSSPSPPPGAPRKTCALINHQQHAHHANSSNCAHAVAQTFPTLQALTSYKV
jgi:hypothetical protein